MGGAVWMLAILATTSAFKFVSIVQQGFVAYEPETPETLYIPEGQATGELRFPDDYKCNSKAGPVPPVALKVHVLTVSGGPPSIEMSHDLKSVDIYRMGSHLTGDAKVTITKHCVDPV